MKVIKGRAQGADSTNRSETFTGTVWADPVLSVPGEISVNTVYFEPGARTYWHSHERGQILNVVAGQGIVATDGGETAEIRPGDIVWIPPGERHWHGAARSSYMVHVATSLGRTLWQEEVSELYYAHNNK